MKNLYLCSLPISHWLESNQRRLRHIQQNRGADGVEIWFCCENKLKGFAYVMVCVTDVFPLIWGLFAHVVIKSLLYYLRRQNLSYKSIGNRCIYTQGLQLVNVDNPVIYSNKIWSTSIGNQRLNAGFKHNQIYDKDQAMATKQKYHNLVFNLLLITAHF